MKQIGQILVEQRWIEPATLARALVDQRHTGKRICSLLIARGLLDPDHAARALANQHNVPGVLQKHLEHRDRSLAQLLPAGLARSTVALPIGRTSNDELIICVRAPKPELAASLAAAAGCPVIIVVAPAYQLEQLVKQVYDSMPGRSRATRNPHAADDDDDAIDVDLTTRPIAIIRGEIPMLGDPLDHLGTMTLVGLDDVRVAKDPSQIGQPAAQPRGVTTMSSLRTAAPSAAAPAPGPPERPGMTGAPGRATAAPIRPPGSQIRAAAPVRATAAAVRAAVRGPTLDATLAAIEHAGTLDDATDAAMGFIAQRFHHAVWFAIHEGVALGERGHGVGLSPEVVQAIAVPLGAPSIVQLAHATRQPATSAPGGAIQDRLSRTLGTPTTPAAVPVEVGGEVAYVLAVGDPSHTPDSAVDELAQLGGALGAAYDRLAST